MPCFNVCTLDTGGWRVLQGVVFEGLNVYQYFVSSSNGGHQSIRGAILPLKKCGHNFSQHNSRAAPAASSARVMTKPHDFVYVISHRVHQRAPATDRL